MPTWLVCAALLAALVLVFQMRPIWLPILAGIAAGIEAATAFGLIHISLGRIPLSPILGGVLAVTGVVLWLRASAKSAIAAATVVALAGLLQLANALHLR